MLPLLVHVSESWYLLNIVPHAPCLPRLVPACFPPYLWAAGLRMSLESTACLQVQVSQEAASPSFTLVTPSSIAFSLTNN